MWGFGVRSLENLHYGGSLGILGSCCKWESLCYSNEDTLCGKCRRVCESGVVTELVPRGVDYVGVTPCKFGEE